MGYAIDERNLRAPDLAVGNVPSRHGWVTGVPPLALECADEGGDEAELQKRIGRAAGLVEGRAGPELRLRAPASVCRRYLRSGVHSGADFVFDTDEEIALCDESADVAGDPAVLHGCEYQHQFFKASEHGTAVAGTFCDDAGTCLDGVTAKCGPFYERAARRRPPPSRRRSLTRLRAAGGPGRPACRGRGRRRSCSHSRSP